ncbi:uncharacterized protein LOC123539495 [Mercenaria mercenaria]|uniref:uncharacterized protein LOC123539495 n=1 Tax=Mercenaria mercenaria TaxID=6596 RepID=UPI00234EB3B8|nr:uncharacterized protein LOC123539495 [Mercenaria mercenaria]
MGNSSSSAITTDLLIREVRSVGSSLSARDTKLFNCAKSGIAKESGKCTDCELYIDFKDQDGILIKTNSNPSGKIYVGYDGNTPIYEWKNRGFLQAAKTFFINSFHAILNVIPAVGLRAIAFK